MLRIPRVLFGVGSGTQACDVFLSLGSNENPEKKHGSFSELSSCKMRASFAFLFAWYFSYFGPEARNRKKKWKNIGFGLPQKIGKNNRKTGKWPLNPNFAHLWAISLFFGCFLFSGGGRNLPSQQEKIHVHSFVLEPELEIQYTYTYVKNSERHRFGIRYTYLALFAIIYRVQDMNTHR